MMQMSRTDYMSQLSQLDSNIQQGEEQMKKLRAQRDVSKLFLEMNDSSCKEMMVFCSQGYHMQMLNTPSFFNCADGGEMKMTISYKDGMYSCQTDETQCCFYSQDEMMQFTQNCTWDNDCCEINVSCVKVSPAWGFITEDNSQTVSVANVNQQGQTTPQMQAQGQTTPQMQAQGQTTPQMQAQGQTTPQMQAQGQTTPQMQAQGQTTPQPSVSTQ